MKRAFDLILASIGLIFLATYDIGFLIFVDYSGITGRVVSTVDSSFVDYLVGAGRHWDFDQSIFLIFCTVGLSLLILKRSRASGIVYIPIVITAYALVIKSFAIQYEVLSGVDTQHAFNCKCILDYSSSTYFSVVTIATVGYGDIYPTNDASRWYVCIEIITGVLFNLTLFALVAARIASEISVRALKSAESSLDRT